MNGSGISLRWKATQKWMGAARIRLFRPKILYEGRRPYRLIVFPSVAKLLMHRSLGVGFFLLPAHDISKVHSRWKFSATWKLTDHNRSTKQEICSIRPAGEKRNQDQRQLGEGDVDSRPERRTPPPR
jgi:hypothetical protein